MEWNINGRNGLDEWNRPDRPGNGIEMVVEYRQNE